MRIPFSIFFFLAGMFSSLSVKAVSIEQTAIDILTKSLSYQADNYSLQSAISDFKTQSNLPDPEVAGEYLVMPEDVDNRWTVELTWGVEWPGVYGARNKESKSKISAAQLALRAQRIEQLAEIKDLLLDYIQCRLKLQLLEELSQNNDTIYQLAQKAEKGGELTLLDLNKVKLEYANIRVAKASVVDEENDIIINLSKIYGKDCREVVEAMDCKFPEIIIPSEEGIALIKENSPAVQSALAEAEIARAGKKVAKMEALPSLSLGYKHSFEDAMNFNGATASISLPIFSSRGKQKAAQAAIIDAEFRAETMVNEIETETSATYRRLKNMAMQIQEIAPIVENADYNATLLKAYQNGAMSLIDYISDRNYFTSAALELVALRLNAAKALVALQKYMATL